MIRNILVFVARALAAGNYGLARVDDLNVVESNPAGAGLPTRIYRVPLTVQPRLGSAFRTQVSVQPAA